MKLVDCTHERHAQAIVDILNHAIVHTTALYDYQPRPVSQMAGWFAAKQAGAFPVLGIEADDGTLMGFASYGTFRAFAAFKYTVEHSVYVHPDHRRQGLAGVLLQELVRRAESQQLHVMVGVIDTLNEASLSLHRRLGFELSGTLRQTGFKFGRWLDVHLMQRTLAGPACPVDG